MSTDAIGYMCKVSFEDDLRGASDGTRIFPSEEALRHHAKCIAQCGAVKVRVSLVEVIQEEDYSELLADIRASGMSASGQDPQGLEVKPASPTPKGDAQ